MTTARRSFGARLFALLTPRRLTVWSAGLFVLTWGLYAYSMSTKGYIDRAGRFKASDFIQFYVMGSLVSSGRVDALYDSDAHLEEGRRRIHPELGLYAGHVNYGPQVAFAFAPWSRLPFAWALGLFLVASVAIYGLSVWILWRDAAWLRPHGWRVALLAAASPLLAVVVRYGQLSAFTLLFWVLALAALRRQRQFLAGLAIGCLVFKPQLGVAIGVALLLAGNWRIVAGAAVSGGGQVLVAWLLAGTRVMREYVAMLATLAANPALVQLYPSEVHSWRGFVQLLVSPPALVSAIALLGTLAALCVGVWAWRRGGGLDVRWSLVVLLTILASPHLLSYDLVLLVIPLMAVTDWGLGDPGNPWRRPAVLLLVPLYFAPFSSNLARAIPVQLSVVVMVALVWCLARALTAARSRDRLTAAS